MPSITSESDTMFNERDRRCAAVLVLYRSQLWQQDHCQHPRLIATNNRDVPRVMKTKFPATVIVFGMVSVRATSRHLTSSKSAWKSTLKCTWMCWRVWWSPGAIRWPVADLGCGSRTQRRRTSPKRPRLSFRRSATTLYPSLTGPLLPRP